MLKPIFSILGLGAVAVLITGCASSSSGGGVETRAYIADKDRVDQNMQGGNYGYIMGTPKAPDRSNISKTRQVYTLEITKNPDVTPEDLRKPVSPAAPVVINVPDRHQQVNQAPIQEQAVPYVPETQAATPSGVVESTASEKEYVVQSGDTLQKISKKFYGGYSKWNKIYEANKDIIPNPNKIKKGLTIRIPE